VPGGWRQHGAVPPKGATLRMSRYRHGGGLLGNVERDRLTILRKPLAGVASVTNPLPARGGTEVEPQPAARLRAADELRTRYRAVTADDFETIALRASARVARARCVKPAPGEAIVVAILPGSARPEGPLGFQDLVAPEDLRQEVLDELEACCLLGTSVHVTPVALRGVTVAVEVEASPSSDPRDVEAAIFKALHAYLNPLVGGDLSAVVAGRPRSGDGWEWGRPLSEGELRPLLRSVPGVEAITILRLYETDLATGNPSEPPLQGQLVLEPDELIASGHHVVRAVQRGTG
jgi:predicted phage baseplate assembly protein